MYFEPISAHFSRLLFSADSQEAEDSLAAVIGTIECSKETDEDALAVIQAALVRKIIGSSGIISPAEAVEARSMLQPGLQPLLKLERLPRVCFVLRMLVGFDTSACAQMLGIDEGGVKVSLRVAVLQQHQCTEKTSWEKI
jgi:DNA-directed RNA polymerase specialized sigma24 family protein